MFFSDNACFSLSIAKLFLQDNKQKNINKALIGNDRKALFF